MVCFGWDRMERTQLLREGSSSTKFCLIIKRFLIWEGREYE